MSFRERKQFKEHLRALGYSEFISQAILVISNFETLATILLWLVVRLAPDIQLPDEIQDVQARLTFLQAATKIIYTRTSVKLNI